MTMFDPSGKSLKSPNSSGLQNQTPSPGKSTLVDQLGGGTPSPPPQQVTNRAVTDLAKVPAMNVVTELQSFSSGGGVAAELVAAEKKMAGEHQAAQLTIAMFQFMHTHAGALAAVIQKAFSEIEFSQRDQYLQDLSGEMTNRIQRGLWYGEDRQLVCAEALPPTEYFQRGKVTLLQKANTAKSLDKPLVKLLENHSANMDAKSYGRRLESMEAIDVSSLPVDGGGRAVPKANEQVALDDPLCKYFDEMTYQEVAAKDLVVDEDYALQFNVTTNVSVTIGSKTNTHVVFSEVS